MIAPRLKELLDQNGVSYHRISHPDTYHAHSTATATHVPSRQFAKTVIVKADKRLCMVVLPASDRIHLQDLRAGIGAHALELATEREIRDVISDCEVGAMPPFGDFYGMEVFVSPHLREDEDIVFNGGTHNEAVRMHYRDYERLAHPNPMRM
ncbi:MAG: YbaK/EbsC family protein [Aquisalimonadaceae bacterium]